ncbi:20724_t:CDS:2, partial [Rhizophagus irregularis]
GGGGIKVEKIISQGSGEEDGIECGHYYNDRSTTSNFIHHLATKHKIYKPGSAEEATHLKEVRFQPDIRTAIKKQYKQIRQNVTEFIIDDNQPFYILQSKSFRKLILSLDEHFEIPCDKSVKVMIGEAFKWSQEQLLELLKHVIGDVSTRWNSTFYAWERLIELKRAIKFLP